MLQGFDVDDDDIKEDGLENDDLYGDLESNIFERSIDRNISTRDELEQQIAELQEALQTVRKDRISLKSKIRSLTRMNAVLLSNAEALYETAKFEIGRKNVMLTQLQKRFQEVTKKIEVGTRVSKEDIQEILQNCGDISRETYKVKSMKSIRLAVEAFKGELTNTKSKARGRANWSKKIHYNNMSVYFHSEQIPFHRLEKVTFNESRGEQDSLKTISAASKGKLSESLSIPNSSTECTRLQYEFGTKKEEINVDDRVIVATSNTLRSLGPSKLSVDEGEQKSKAGRRSSRSNSPDGNRHSQKYSKRSRPWEREVDRNKSRRSKSHERQRSLVSRGRREIFPKRRRSRSKSHHNREKRDERRDYRDRKRSYV